jgi:nitroreductase
MEVIKRILSAGLKAPTNDHMRKWEFVVLNDKKEIEKIIKKIPKKVSEKRVDFVMKTWGLKNDCQVKMYHDAIPKQYSMLLNGCLVLPFYEQKGTLMEPKTLSSLNAFASIWCCMENIFLASAAEGLGVASKGILNLSLQFPIKKDRQQLS